MAKDIVQSQKGLPQSAKFSKLTLKDFLVPWGMLCAAFPRQDVGAATVAIYYDRLQRFGLSQIIEAVNITIDKSKFFPSVAEIIEAVRVEPDKATYQQPTKEEAGAVLEKIQSFISELEGRNSQIEKDRIAERKALLKKQAELLGVKSKASQ